MQTLLSVADRSRESDQVLADQKEGNDLGFLRRLLGQKDASHTTVSPHSSAPEDTRAAGYRSPEGGFTDAQLELLSRLPRTQIDMRLAELWEPLVGQLDSIVKRFLRDGLIEEAGILEKLEVSHKVPDLKRILSERGIKPKGKKTDLAAQVVEVLRPADADALLRSVRLYRATERGQQVINEYLKRKRRRRERMESDALGMLLSGDIDGAGRRVARYESGQVFPRGVGLEWSRGMPRRTVEQAKWLVGHSYDDLDLDNEHRRLVGAQLALSDMLGEGTEKAGKRILNTIGREFSCRPLEEFLRQEPCGGYASGRDPEKPADLAELYAHTKLFEASAVTMLAEYRSLHFAKGIEITRADDGCRMCDKGKVERYTWNQRHKIPKLPRHWGCRCVYSAWLEE